MDQTVIRILVVDDHAIVRKGIRALLAEVGDIEVIGEASDGQGAVEQAEALNPDVILMDLVMPRVDGIEAIRQITARDPGLRILVLTARFLSVCPGTRACARKATRLAFDLYH